MDVAQVLDAAPAPALIAPYGGTLVQAFVPAEQREPLLSTLHRLTRIEVSEDEFHDIEMLGSGAYSPLRGFMTRESWQSVCHDGILPSGLAWGLPVTLAVTAALARRLDVGKQAALYYRGEPVGLLRVADVFPWEPKLARRGYEADEGHPVLVERGRAGKSLLIGGEVKLLACRNESFLQHHHRWPRETRNLFQQRGWHRVAAVHVRNPWQRAHEYLLKCALESSDGLLLHAPIDDYAQVDGIRSAALSVASRLLLTDFFPGERIIINPVPRGVFAPGARAALQHAIVSQNAGCDVLYLMPSGPQSSSAERHALPAGFAAAAARGLGVRSVFLATAFHCERCGGVATDKSCPHDATARMVMTPDQIAETLRRGEQLPVMVTRPEVARALARAVAEAAEAPPPGRHLYPHTGEVSRMLRQTLIGHRPCVLWMTGLSGAGKSSIAHRLERALLLTQHRVTVLDGDTLRHGLSRDLGFSDEARRENLRRAGEVAKILMDAGMIVIASFISPFAAERQMVRERFSEGFFEIFIDASLEVCEARDPKGLYRRARSGQIAAFTGVSSPYESPARADLRLDTATATVDECVDTLLRFLTEIGVLRLDAAAGMPHAASGHGISRKSQLQ